jgi:sigma-E factor negative regulatory protein RseB
MTGTLFHRTSLLFLGLMAPVVQAADPQAMLTRIQRSAQSLNYDGTFVYQHGDQLDSLRIVHKAGDGAARERLISLNGAPREIVRTEQEVRCYLPDENAVTVEHRGADQRNFPAFLPGPLTAVDSAYRVRVGKGGRVTGRQARAVLIRPRDSYRYGYQLWADEDTGLLLKASLVDENGVIIEQYMFTQVVIGRPIPDSELAPQNPGKGFVWQRAADAPEPAPTVAWRAGQIPSGFRLTASMQRHLPDRRQPVGHLVYSDGLAVVSVFVEPVENTRNTRPLNGLTRMGGVHAFGRVVDDHQITVVGEVPAATVELIGSTMTLQH